MEGTSDTSGTTESIVAGSMEQVVAAFMDRVRKTKEIPTSTLAVAFDVDDTMIRWSNQDETMTAVITPIWTLVQYLVAHDIRVYVITARHHVRDGIPYMLTQLEKAGYDVKAISSYRLTPRQNIGDSHPGPFKYQARRNLIMKDGVQLVGMVGDKLWDMFPSGHAPVSTVDDLSYLFPHPDDVTLYGLKVPCPQSRSSSSL
jgi:hypothetical protein